MTPIAFEILGSLWPVLFTLLCLVVPAVLLARWTHRVPLVMPSDALVAAELAVQLIVFVGLCEVVSRLWPEAMRLWSLQLACIVVALFFGADFAASAMGRLVRKQQPTLAPLTPDPTAATRDYFLTRIAFVVAICIVVSVFI
jgi:hypothetical protein